MDTHIGRYTVVRALDVGARDVHLVRYGHFTDVLALVKANRADASELTTVLARTRGAAHPGLSSVLSCFMHEDRQAIVCAASHGIDLARLTDHLRLRQRRLPDPVIYYLGAALADALCDAHSAADPCAHGLLTPRHVLLSWGAGVKLVGLGLAPLFARALQLGAIEETMAAFAAPELRVRRGARGRPGPACDVYSISLLLWSLLADLPPPSDPRLLQPLPTLHAGVPRALARVIHMGLRIDPQQRRVTTNMLTLLLREMAGPEARPALRAILAEVQTEVGDDGLVPDAAAFPPAALDGSGVVASQAT